MRWAEEHAVSTEQPSILEIAHFLNFLFKVKGLQPSTIQGYRTALADRLNTTLREGIASDRYLSRLLRSFFRDRPKTLRSLPPWNLSLVLHVLSGEPFEPLHIAQPKFLTLKAMFLLVLATGHRRSELHALSREKISHTQNWSHIALKPDPSFLAKNQDPAGTIASFEHVTIPALAGGFSQDRSLCPVRALRIYLQNTDNVRNGRKKLFMTIRPPKEDQAQEISPITISGWLKQVIRLAYEQVKPTVVEKLHIQAHQVRATASSWAAIGGSSVDQVMKACHWRSHSTFTKFYLADQT